MNRVVCCQVALTDGYKLYLVCGLCFWQHDKHVNLLICVYQLFLKMSEVPGETAGMHGLKETGKIGGNVCVALYGLCANKLLIILDLCHRYLLNRKSRPL